MTVPQWFLMLAAVCIAVRALFGLASITDREREPEDERATPLTGSVARGNSSAAPTGEQPSRSCRIGADVQGTLAPPGEFAGATDGDVGAETPPREWLVARVPYDQAGDAA